MPWSNLRKRKKRPLKLIIQKRFPILNSNQSPKIIMSVSSIAALEISTHFQTSKGVSLQHELLICNQFLRNKNDFSHLSNHLKYIRIRQCNRFFLSSYGLIKRFIVIVISLFVSRQLVFTSIKSRWVVPNTVHHLLGNWVDCKINFFIFYFEKWPTFYLSSLRAHYLNFFWAWKKAFKNFIY